MKPLPPTVKLLPILFSTAMVQAILTGQKTVTRRTVRPSNTVEFSTKKKDLDFSQIRINPPTGVKVAGLYETWWRGYSKYQPGDLIWVRETWGMQVREYGGGYGEYYVYKATNPNAVYCNTAGGNDLPVKWKPSIHMPRNAARIWLRVKDVRPEYLHNITPDDIRAEGVRHDDNPADALLYDRWIKLWNSINESNGLGWLTNPPVWRIEYERTDAPFMLSKN